ncbi:MAG: CDGSH iron-sulfur domain-containing protein [Acidimicrobiales bacterium]
MTDTPPSNAGPTPAPSPTAAPAAPPAITVAPNGPLVVNGGVPLYRRRAVQSEHGEPLTWVTTEHIEAGARYALCRCGLSERKPFCDRAHAKAGFDGTEAAARTYDERSNVLGGTGIEVRDDRSICVHAGFCGTRLTNVWKQVAETGESTVRAQVIAMVERCPSGALTYRMEGAEVEPLLPQAIAVTDDGPLWVTGSIPITGSDGVALETRNRVTLCRCGASANKPLCDGNHKNVGFAES